VPPPGYLPEATALCRRHGTLFILDEVQTGLGRTGQLFALEQEQLEPDAVALAKSLGGGLVPVGALVARAEHHERAYGSPQRCHDHATTFGGGPLAMAAVLGTLRVLAEDDLVARAAAQGERLRVRLEELASRHRSIREIRGRGLMLGIKFEDVTRGALERTLLRGLGATSSYLFVQSVALRLLDEHRIIAQSAVNEPGVLKVMPPLAVEDAHIDRFVSALDAVLGQAGHVAALAHLARAVLERGGRD
jgi:putrescine aminotransferase